jgi:hypothetical protein
MTWLLLALLSSAYIRNFNGQYSVLIVIAIAAYAALDLKVLHISEPRRNLLRLTLAVLVVFFVAIVPTLLEIAQRHATAPYEHIHDGAIQTEEAAKFLLAGQNPYGADYSRTPMALWLLDCAMRENPALHHNGYTPLTFLMTAPALALSQSLLGWFDIRFILLPALVAILLLLPRLADDWDKKLALIIAVGLNPLFVPFFIQGRNDVLILLAVVLVVILLQRRQIAASAFVLGLACVTKQTAWFILPLFFSHLFFSGIGVREMIRRALIPLAIPFVVFVVPFVVWDARAFVEDILIYPTVSFPVMGYGFGQLLILFGIMPSDTAPFPFFLFALLFGLSSLILLLCYQRAQPSLRTFIAASAILTFVLAFFNRVFQDNYLGYVIALGTLACFLKREA